MDQITHDVRRQNWLNIITACQRRPSDTTARQWLSDNDIKEKAYYYCLRKFRRESAQVNQLPAPCAFDDVAFVEMPLSGISSESVNGSTSSPVTIHKNEMTIEISNSLSGQLLTKFEKNTSFSRPAAIFSLFNCQTIEM